MGSLKGSDLKHHGDFQGSSFRRMVRSLSTENMVGVVKRGSTGVRLFILEVCHSEL